MAKSGDEYVSVEKILDGGGYRSHVTVTQN